MVDRFHAAAKTASSGWCSAEGAGTFPERTVPRAEGASAAGARFPFCDDGRVPRPQSGRFPKKISSRRAAVNKRSPHSNNRLALPPSTRSRAQVGKGPNLCSS